MIGSLRGRISIKRPSGIIIDVIGVGYEVSLPISVLASLPEEGSEVFLYIYTHVREDNIQLFGFLGEEEKGIFLSLLGVSGIGPRIALNILSGISKDDFIKAVETEDVGLLTRIPGLGKKTAHRLILELREKLPTRRETKDRIYTDALSALINLGYKKSDAQTVVDAVYKKGVENIEELLKESLKHLTKQDKK